MSLFFLAFRSRAGFSARFGKGAENLPFALPNANYFLPDLQIAQATT
jgi:hypothetical protein